MNHQTNTKQERVIPILYLVLLVVAISYIVCALTMSKPRITSAIENAQMVEIEATILPETVSGTQQYEIEFSDAETSHMALQFLSSHCTVHVYNQDHVLLYAVENEASLFGSTPGTRINFVEIPYGTTKVLVVFQEVFATGSAKNCTFYYGDGVRMLRDLVTNSLPAVIISILIIAIGFVTAGYWVITHRKIHQNVGALYFGILSGLMGFWCLNETDLVMTILVNRTVGSLAGYNLLMMIPIPLILYSRSFFKIKNRFIGNLLCLLAILNYVTLLTLHITGVMQFKQSVLAIHMILVLSLAYMAGCIIAHIRYHGMDRRCAINLIAMGILLASAGVDFFFYYMGFQQTDVWGKIGILIYIAILSGETMHDAMQQVQEGHKAEFYKELAEKDVMTDLLNRSAFEKWEEGVQSESDTMIVLFDLNCLKHHNDTYGHQVGDAYIVAAARLLHNVFGARGKCFRVGGDEFCVVIERGRSFPIEDFLQQLEKEEHEFNEKTKVPIQMEMAYGYAIREPEESIIRTRERADHMLYVTKNKQKENQSDHS